MAPAKERVEILVIDHAGAAFRESKEKILNSAALRLAHHANSPKTTLKERNHEDLRGFLRAASARTSESLRSSCSLLGCTAVYAQGYEITPLIGGMFGGTVSLEEQGAPNFQAHLQDRLSYGISGGIRYDADDCRKCNLIEFRWLRQDTHLVVRQDPLVALPASVFRPPVTSDHFLADFTHEWPLKDVREGMIRPFLTATLGAVRMSTPDASATRFVFWALGPASSTSFPNHTSESISGWSTCRS